MKKIILFFCLVFGFRIAAQIPNIPDSINYQAVLRDASGAVMPAGTSGTLNFRIFSDLISASADYEENHSFTVSAIGVVNLYIGGGSKVGNNTFANVNWATGAASYEVRLDGTLISPRLAFASVPYALYAKSSGNGALPNGSVNQTLYRTASTWTSTSNFSNDGARLAIGLANPSPRIKLNIFSGDFLDTTVVFATKLTGGNNHSLYRGFISGSTSSTNNFPFLFGADIRTRDNGSGYGIGVFGASETNSGTAIGVSGNAQGPVTSTIIGIYGSVDTLNGNPNAYAAVFDKGKVLVGGSIYFPSATAIAGSVYKIDVNKRGYWAPAGASTGSVTINQSGIVNVSPSGIPSTLFTISALAPIFGTSGIGTVVPGAYPNYNLNIPTPSISFNGVTGNLTYAQTPFSTNVNISPNLSLLGSLLTVGTSTVIIPGTNIWSKPTATAVALVNGSDNVGIGTTTPLQKLDVQGYLRVGAGSLASDEGWLLYSPSPGLSILRAGGRATTEMRLDQNNNAPMTFWAAGTERFRVLSNGNVGIGTTTPSDRLELIGNVKIPAANDYMYATAKTKTISIPAASFLPENSSAYGRAMIAGNVYIPDGSVGAAGYLEAGVNLPDGATVTAISAFVVDDDATYNISLVQLWRNDASIFTSYGNAVTMAQTPASAGLNTNVQVLSDNTVSNAVVDNSLYTYYLRFGGVQANPNMRIVKVLITYIIIKAD